MPPGQRLLQDGRVAGDAAAHAEGRQGQVRLRGGAPGHRRRRPGGKDEGRGRPLRAM